MRRSAAIAAIAATTACSSTSAPDAAATMTADGLPPVLLTADADRWPHDAYEFTGMQRSGDTLTVAIRFGGGCRTHEFALLVSPAFMESYPVQMSGSLAHDAHGDTCRAIVHDTLRLDLSPLRRAYTAAYRTESDTLVLHVAGWPLSVRYAF